MQISFSTTHLSTIVQIGYSLLISLIYAEISENLGQNVLFNFFTGKYHKPILEKRIFMFTDLKDSTKIAENLGSLKYFEFLKAYYNDLSDAIIFHYGEVYQYIGDEIVISWKSNKKKNYVESIHCFFAMKKQLLKKKDWYLKNYGVFPEFKAGIHTGNVTIGEIGALKKEIFFTGDVLNTTSRIQSLCTKYNSELLTSHQFVEHLPDKTDFSYALIKEVDLKGKLKSLKLYYIKESGS